MKWHQYVTSFFTGLFLVNSIPHYLHGIFGYSFPTPFADPPGVGLSSPSINLMWALFNMSMCFLFYYLTKFNEKNRKKTILFVVGLLVMSLMFNFTMPQKVI